MGAYGNNWIKTPALDSLAAKSVRFDGHYVSSFPTVPARADHQTGQWTMSFMGWEPLPSHSITLADILSEKGYVTAAVVDTPYYIRDGMNFDRGFQGFFFNPSQDATLIPGKFRTESHDLRSGWRSEADHAAPQTFTWAMQWLQRHYKENFFLYIDTWDPHEPWDAPNYYTELYMPDYDGEVIDPPYNRWQDVPGFTEAKVKKAHASYCGEVTMVDTWIGYLMRCVENMGLMEKTAIIFTTDHGFLFGEHGGHFGKSVYTNEEGTAAAGWMQAGAGWGHDPLYDEIIRIPLLDVCARGEGRGVRQADGGGGCDADGDADPRAADTRTRGGKQPAGEDARFVVAGAGVRDQWKAVRESRSGGETRRQLPASGEGAFEHGGDDRRMVAAVCGGGREVGAVSPGVGPRAGA